MEHSLPDLVPEPYVLGLWSRMNASEPTLAPARLFWRSAIGA
jgi:hypothetical protein